MRAIIIAALALSACTTAQVGASVADGQLFCAAKSAVVVMQSVSGQAILAKGATAKAVNAVCGLIGGIAVSPPASGVAGTVTVALPASISIPVAPS